MGRPPRCNKCCTGYAPLEIGDIFFFGGNTSQRCDGYVIGTDSWVVKSDFSSTARSAFCLSAEGKGYATSVLSPDFASGNADHDQFNPTADSWQVMANYPGYGSNIGASVGGLLYMSGIASSTPPLRSYNPATDSWSVLATQPREFSVAQSFTDGVDVYASGGDTIASNYSRIDVHKYDISGDSWSTLTDMPRKRERGGAFSTGTNAYMLGGRETRAAPPFDFPRLQLDTYSYGGDSWSTNTSLPSSGTYRELLAGTHQGGYGYAMSGTGVTANLGRNDRYDISGDSWSALTQITSARAELQRSATIP